MLEIADINRTDCATQVQVAPFFVQTYSPLIGISLKIHTSHIDRAPLCSTPRYNKSRNLSLASLYACLIQHPLISFTVNPTLYQLNIRLRLHNLSQELNHPATLNDIPDRELDRWAKLGFDWIYALGIWETGTLGREVSRTNPDWVREYKELLPDLTESDICGSCFAIKAYQLHPSFGDSSALKEFGDRLHQRGLKLMLDFVPNHTAPDHPWVQEHPDFYIQGSPEDRQREPQNYTEIPHQGIFAHGRDPYFTGWPDTLQLNYGHPAVLTAMTDELLSIAQVCDGVRCDMAMLILPDIFHRTWGIIAHSFWPSAIQTVKQQHPTFTFMAEVYWGLEWTLQQQGFDYTYDKRLYDRLHSQQAHPVREHFSASLDYQERSVRFLENHDEPRAAGTFPLGSHQAAALLTYLCPGLRFFHHGQLQGWTQKVSIHLCRSAKQVSNPALEHFYEQLLQSLSHPVLREGNWQLLDCSPAWEYNGTWANFIAFGWHNDRHERVLVVVNYAPYPGQCYVHIPWDWQPVSYALQDLISTAYYERQGEELSSQGLYLDIAAWKGHVFGISAIAG
ncbi:MAG: alpha-amylase [Roseofilum sp. SBFL]|uniref:alpha-amylase family glycosyl hydrolase n=1 Tax=unclassified Roseofilum TaxID=2620099 RepID=UPI001B1FAB75|nr:MULTISPECIES: alpha-amylase family glycosyl hydrolase [unclassified Roseofilum]MBP0013088.1 alpha-amylase [Roseofilum sp. SID3]MBP0023744.1 alpha-amylase [Roseofilum sp. SID2]MBP0036816.1 alpha-amylase [Roseofilum sp. SID1]MBP0042606.1 alpha-amylase [Roseofilum sp. SBFL]